MINLTRINSKNDYYKPENDTDTKGFRTHKYLICLRNVLAFFGICSRAFKYKSYYINQESFKHWLGRHNSTTTVDKSWNESDIEGIIKSAVNAIKNNTTQIDDPKPVVKPKELVENNGQSPAVNPDNKPVQKPVENKEQTVINPDNKSDQFPVENKDQPIVNSDNKPVQPAVENKGQPTVNPDNKPVQPPVENKGQPTVNPDNKPVQPPVENKEQPLVNPVNKPNAKGKSKQEPKTDINKDATPTVDPNKTDSRTRRRNNKPKPIQSPTVSRKYQQVSMMNQK